MEQEILYPVTKKEMYIIKKQCYHPYWDECGGLNPCEYFDENNCDCNFDVDEFIELICKQK